MFSFLIMHTEGFESRQWTRRTASGASMCVTMAVAHCSWQLWRTGLHTTLRTTILLAGGMGVEDEQNGLLVVCFCRTKLQRMSIVQNQENWWTGAKYPIHPFSPSFWLLKEKCRGCVFQQAEVFVKFWGQYWNLTTYGRVRALMWFKKCTSLHFALSTALLHYVFTFHSVFIYSLIYILMSLNLTKS
jgi:hypothetical protein